VLQGTAASVNGVFVSMGEEEDVCKVAKLSEAMGGVAARGGSIAAVPPMVIGGASNIAPISQATGYATIANHGITCSPIAIDKVVNPDGSTVPVPGADCHRTVPVDVSNAVAYALHGVVTGGTMAGDAPDSNYFLGKTGTTDNAQSTWEIGSTSKVTTAVWVGGFNLDANLRAIYDFPNCPQQGSGQAAIERHCIWSAIQYAMDKRFGGAKTWAAPDEKYLDGGVPLTVADAKPVVIAPPKPKPTKPTAPVTPTPAPTGGPTGAPTPPVNH
jgi:membrane peptidoglycan carboxypeptidase